jgi:hypothetical protein
MSRKIRSVSASLWIAPGGQSGNREKMMRTKDVHWLVACANVAAWRGIVV